MRNFSKKEPRNSITMFVDKIPKNWDESNKQHSVIIKFKLLLVDNVINYNDPDNKSKGYKIKDGKPDYSGQIPITPKGKKSA